MTEAVTCLVADDHPAVVAVVCLTLEEHGFRVAGRAGDGADALSLIEADRPAVAVVDLRMPRVSGIEVARRAAGLAPETAVILYTAFGDRALLTEALDAGARGFVLKEAPVDELVRAVEIVAEGGVYVDPALGGLLARAVTTSGSPVLTRRESEVLRLLADGLGNEEIGKRLSISPETVRTHVRKAMARLDADTGTQAVAMAIRQSLISCVCSVRPRRACLRRRLLRGQAGRRGGWEIVSERSGQSAISNELIEVFRAEVGRRLERLRHEREMLERTRDAGARELERRALGDEAHGIMGAAAVVGCDDLRELAQELEQEAAGATRLRLDRIDHLLEALAASLERLDLDHETETAAREGAGRGRALERGAEAP